MQLGSFTFTSIGLFLYVSPTVVSFVSSRGSKSMRPRASCSDSHDDPSPKVAAIDRRDVLQLPLAILLATGGRVTPARASTVEEVAVWGTSTDEQAGAANKRPRGKINPNVTMPEVTERCFLDLSVDGKPPARLTIALFGKAAPKTTANFVSLCLGTGPNGATYKGTNVYRVVKDLNVGFGDVGGGGDNCVRSSTCVSGSGAPIPVENFDILHSEWSRVVVSDELINLTPFWLVLVLLQLCQDSCRWRAAERTVRLTRGFS
jgi:hypothetical protein